VLRAGILWYCTYTYLLGTRGPLPQGNRIFNRPGL
jgi:hypothetical protein